jgi:hypothetical protein
MEYATNANLFLADQRGGSMKISAILVFALLASIVPAQVATKDAAVISIVGYVRDSACVHRFHEIVKPLPNGCVQDCVRAGSPLVLLTRDEKIYHPISAQMPDVDVRSKLLPFTGKLVKITGHVYDRAGSQAITVDQIKEVPE